MARNKFCPGSGLESGSVLTKFCGSGSAYDQCGPTSLPKCNKFNFFYKYFECFSALLLMDISSPKSSTKLSASVSVSFQHPIHFLVILPTYNPNQYIVAGTNLCTNFWPILSLFLTPFKFFSLYLLHYKFFHSAY